MDLKKKGFLINPIKYKFSINCSPNETNYYAITQNKNPKLYNSRNNFYPNNYTSQNLDYSNNLNNQDFFTEKVKRIINKETEGDSLCIKVWDKVNQTKQDVLFKRI